MAKSIFDNLVLSEEGLRVQREANLGRLASFLEAFMHTRCQVSSQHKLPCLEEILELETMEMFQELFHITDADVKMVIREFIKQGKWFKYGPYMSDHPIEVM